MTNEGTGAPAPTRGVRRELAEGDGLTRYPPGGPFALRFDSRREWDGWRARDEGDLTRATFPGTPVRVEGEWYEVVRAEPMGARFVYYLAPWQERFPLRDPRELSAEACRREHARQQERERRQQLSVALAFMAPFVGLLPAEEQERIERELGLPAVRATLFSSLAFGLPAMALVALGLMAMAQPRLVAPGLRWTGDVLLLSVFVFADSVVRLVHAVAGQAAGSAPVVLLTAALRRIGMGAAGWRRRPQRAPAGAFVGVRDEVRALPATGMEEAGFEIVSRLPKDHWTLNVTPILYAGTHWAAVEREELAVDDGVRHRFVLRPYAGQALRAVPVDYAPDEVEHLHRRQVLADRQLWIALGGALWGMLDEPRQAALARIYRYDPEQQTRHSTTLGLVFGGIGAALALVYLATGTAKCIDVVMLLGGGAVAGESLLRRRRLDRGVISGSFLGVPLRPFASRLQRGLGS
jgi:hypothetical protein